MIQRGSRLNDLGARLARLFDLDGLPQWTPLVYANNWVDYGAPYAAGAWFRDPLGVAHLRGLIKRASGSHTNGETMVSLPAGARPTTQKMFNQRINLGSVRVDVATDGRVILWDDPAPTAGTAETYLSLDGIAFRTS